MSEYIRTNKFDTNECPNIFVKEKLIRMNVRIYICDQYIRIFEYIRHTLVRAKLKSLGFQGPLKILLNGGMVMPNLHMVLS